jgi:hypothetical protein
MGGGDRDDPYVSPPNDEGTGGTEEVDEGQASLDEHSPDEASADDQTPAKPNKPDSSGGTPGGAPVGGGGAGGGGTVETPPNGEGDDEEPDSPDETPDLPDQDVEPPEEDTDVDDTEDEDDDDDEDQRATVVVHSDAWDNVGLGIYPIRLQLQEEYGDQVEIYDELVPVREFDEPGVMAERWEQDARRHQMPVNPSVWNDDPPESSETSNRAFSAAQEQDVGLARDYIRRLRVAAIVEGRNIEDREVLVELATEVGLDTDKLEEDWDDVELPSRRGLETPTTTIHVDGKTIPHGGQIHINDIKMIFEQAGLEEEAPQQLPGFVDEYGPVALKEVQQVYDYSREEALAELENTEGVVPVEYGDATVWATLSR